MPTSRWSDVVGVIWTASALRTHFFAEVVFTSGVISAKSGILEPGSARHWGLPGGLVYQAPGYPASLIIGDEAIDLLDRRFKGVVKEVASVDEFGRPCVEALCVLRELFSASTRFASPVFSTAQEPLEALETRRISTIPEEST